jgi:hypothetical protein
MFRLFVILTQPISNFLSLHFLLWRSNLVIASNCCRVVSLTSVGELVFFFKSEAIKLIFLTTNCGADAMIL